MSLPKKPPCLAASNLVPKERFPPLLFNNTNDLQTQISGWISKIHKQRSCFSPAP